MPVTTFPEYAQGVQETIDEVVASGDAVLVSLQVDQHSSVRGFIGGRLQFHDATELHFREFVDVAQAGQKVMYVYQYQDAQHDLIFRYDNAAHKPALPQPEHRHTLSSVEASPAPTLTRVLDEISRSATHT